MPTKRQRNTLFNILATAGLDPTQCGVDLEELGFGITHTPTDSVFLLLGDDSVSSILTTVGDERQRTEVADRHEWAHIEYAARVWAEHVKEFSDTPDLWAELLREKEVLSGAEYESMGNAPFTRDEQFRIAERLREVKTQLAKQYAISGERRSQIEAKLDEIEEASHRLGRKDWLNIFYGVMFTLIVTQLVPPDAVQHIIAMVIHGLGDLFGFGGPPPAIPPVA